MTSSNVEVDSVWRKVATNVTDVSFQNIGENEVLLGIAATGVAFDTASGTLRLPTYQGIANCELSEVFLGTVGPYDMYSRTLTDMKQSKLFINHA